MGRSIEIAGLFLESFDSLWRDQWPRWKFQTDAAMLDLAYLIGTHLRLRLAFNTPALISEVYSQA